MQGMQVLLMELTLGVKKNGVDPNEEVNTLTSHFSFCCEMFVLDNNFEPQLTALHKLWFGLVTL